MTARFGSLSFLGALTLAMATLGACTQERNFASVDHARLVNADSEPGSWLSHGRTYGERRFSPLDQINPQTIGDLGLVWYADLDTDRGQEATPLMVDGVLYVATAWSKVKAYDAATGETIWEYDPEVDGAWAVNGCCDVVNRGVAVWEGKVFIGTYDGRLVAIDAESGAEIWDVNTIDRSQPYTITGAPRVVKGRVIIGNGGAEFGVRGYVSAYDADTGELDWRFYTVPGNPADGFENEAMAMAAETWSGEWWALGGGGTVWDSMAYDPGLDLLYIGVGNGSPWNHTIRSNGKGDNLFLASIVALDPDTGGYVWHYQTTPGETWDHTATQHMIVTDLRIDGESRRVVMQAPKNGFFYVLDAATGDLISAEPFTQISWATHIDMETGRPVELPEARYDRTGEPYRSLHPPNGAHTWHPMSFSPLTGLVYIPIHEGNMTYAAAEEFVPRRMTDNVGLGPDPTVPADPEEAARANERRLRTHKGRLIAWDPVTQTEVWRSERDGPANGGVLSTAGGLVFQGTSTGEFLALDAESGAALWSAETQTGVMAAPVSYELDGTQYVAVVVGTGGSWAMGRGSNRNDLPNISRVLVYSLGGIKELPVPPEPVARELAPPPADADAETVALGASRYATYCVSCHGPNAVNRGILPDLRYSPLLASSDGWREVVLGGTLAANGMAGFSEVLGVEEADAMRAYVIERAHASMDETSGQ